MRTIKQVVEMAKYCLTHSSIESTKKYGRHEACSMREILGITRTWKRLDEFVSETEMERLVEEERRSEREIADMFGETVSRVKKLKQKYGIFGGKRAHITEIQRKGIFHYRKQGWTYKAIAEKLRLSYEFVSAFSRRNGLKYSNEESLNSYKVRHCGRKRSEAK